MKITIKIIGGILLLIVCIGILLKAMSGNFEGAVVDWANLQIPFWITLPAGIIAFGLIVYLLFKEPINNFIENYDLAGGRL
jgi:hypothetical protein